MNETLHPTNDRVYKGSVFGAIGAITESINYQPISFRLVKDADGTIHKEATTPLPTEDKKLKKAIQLVNAGEFRFTGDASLPMEKIDTHDYSPKEVIDLVRQILQTDYWEDYDISKVCQDASRLTKCLIQFPQLKSVFTHDDFIIRLRRSQSKDLPEAAVPPHPYSIALSTILFELNLAPTENDPAYLKDIATSNLTYVNWDFKREHNPLYNSPDVVNGIVINAADAVRRAGGHVRSKISYDGRKGKIIALTRDTVVIIFDRGGDPAC